MLPQTKIVFNAVNARLTQIAAAMAIACGLAASCAKELRSAASRPESRLGVSITGFLHSFPPGLFLRVGRVSCAGSQPPGAA